MKKQKHRTSSGKMSERMSLLEFLKERSGIRLSKLEAYLDLVDKASVQYIPKDLCKQEFSLSNGQFVITITELAGCINGKTNCSTFTKHFVPNLILLTQNKMCILIRWYHLFTSFVYLCISLA